MNIDKLKVGDKVAVVMKTDNALVVVTVVEINRLGGAIRSIGVTEPDGRRVYVPRSNIVEFTNHYTVEMLNDLYLN